MHLKDPSQGWLTLYAQLSTALVMLKDRASLTPLGQAKYISIISIMLPTCQKPAGSIGWCILLCHCRAVELRKLRFMTDICELTGWICTVIQPKWGEFTLLPEVCILKVQFCGIRSKLGKAGGIHWCLDHGEQSCSPHPVRWLIHVLTILRCRFIHRSLLACLSKTFTLCMKSRLNTFKNTRLPKYWTAWIDHCQLTWLTELGQKPGVLIKIKCIKNKWASSLSSLQCGSCKGLNMQWDYSVSIAWINWMLHCQRFLHKTFLPGRMKSWGISFLRFQHLTSASEKDQVTCWSGLSHPPSSYSQVYLTGLQSCIDAVYTDLMVTINEKQQHPLWQGGRSLIDNDAAALEECSLLRLERVALETLVVYQRSLVSGLEKRSHVIQVAR